MHRLDAPIRDLPDVQLRYVRDVVLRAIAERLVKKPDLAYAKNDVVRAVVTCLSAQNVIRLPSASQACGSKC